MTTENDLVKPVLEILASEPNGRLPTSVVRQRVKEWVRLDAEDMQPLAGRTDLAIDQKVRNLKSHKTNLGNPFFEGLLIDRPRAFEISDKGRRAIKKYLSK